MRGKEKKQAKRRFPVDFHRGLQLFGQQASRLNELRCREIIGRFSGIVVEGPNDVLVVDSLAVPAVAIMSNKITVEQVTKIERRAKNLAGGKVASSCSPPTTQETKARRRVSASSPSGALMLQVA